MKASDGGAFVTAHVVVLCPIVRSIAPKGQKSAQGREKGCSESYFTAKAS